MGRKVIKFGLSEREIDNAIKELEQYKKELVRKAELLRSRVAEKIANSAQSGFAGATVDDLVDGNKRNAHVKVYVEIRDTITLVIADGEDAVWVEFGAGVYHNDSVGSSRHPRGSELGFTIGSYGKGMGKKQVWGFYEEGALHLTRGTPAVMPMYNAVKRVCDEIANIAREVFQ